MTTRTNYKVRCSCGHEGAIRMSENDAPYSACWEPYSMVDLRQMIAVVLNMFLREEKGGTSRFVPLRKRNSMR